MIFYDIPAAAYARVTVQVYYRPMVYVHPRRTYLAKGLNKHMAEMFLQKAVIYRGLQ